MRLEKQWEKMEPDPILMHTLLGSCSVDTSVAAMGFSSWFASLSSMDRGTRPYRRAITYRMREGYVRRPLALQQREHAALEGRVHHAVDDGILRAVRVPRQQRERQRRQRRLLRVVKIRVQHDGVVRQPGQREQYRHHQ